MNMNIKKNESTYKFDDIVLHYNLDTRRFEKLTNDSFFSRTKELVSSGASRTKEFLAKPETKVASLVSYWAVETLVTALGIYAFLSLGMYAPAVVSACILGYLTYATFGVIAEVKI